MINVEMHSEIVKYWLQVANGMQVGIITINGD